MGGYFRELRKVCHCICLFETGTSLCMFEMSMSVCMFERCVTEYVCSDGCVTMYVCSKGVTEYVCSDGICMYVSVSSNEMNKLFLTYIHSDMPY